MKILKFTLMKVHWRNAFIVLALLCLSGCTLISSLGKDEEEENPEIAEDESAAKLYQKGHSQLKANEFVGAIEDFELLEARYPFGRYSQHAQLELAYAYYKQNKHEQAADAVNRFIKLHPQHPNIDYAYYLKGLIAFDSGKNLIHYVVRRDPSNNDPTSLYESFDVFKLLVDSYPDSKYADDAQLRMIFLRNELAEYELKVADYYMRRRAYAAVVNRCKYIMENFQGTEYMPETLFVLQQAYLKLGMDDLANDTHRVYAQNFQTGKGGIIDEEFARGTRSCAEGLWDRFLEKIKARTYYCN